MKFYTDDRQVLIDSYSSSLVRLKKDVTKLLTEPQNTTLLWEVAELIESILPTPPYMSWDSKSCIVCGTEPLDVDTYENLLNEIDELLDYSDFKLDVDYAMPTYITGQQFQYIHPTRKPIQIQFRSNSCTVVNTGKMIPETESKCNLIK
jgi:hypothetical protein